MPVPEPRGGMISDAQLLMRTRFIMQLPQGLQLRLQRITDSATQLIQSIITSMYPMVMAMAIL
jgi:hypothetical protein